MRSGDLLLFRGGGFISKIIQWGSKSPFSHVAVCVSSKMSLIIEAAGGRVRADDTRKIKRSYDIYRVKKVYRYNLNKTVSFLVDKLNNKYDYKGVFFLGLMKLFRLKKTANRWQKNRDYFCSELVFSAFNDGGGLDIVPKVSTAGITSPGDIAKSKIVELVEKVL